MAGRLGVLTGTFPSTSQTFITQEILLLEQCGFDLEIATVHTTKRNIPVLAASIAAPVFRFPKRHGPRLWRANLRALLAHPRAYPKTLRQALRDTRGFPGRRRLRRFLEGGWLVGARRAGRPGGLQHLHCHFLAERAEAGAYAARISGISFTISAHANDIYTGSPELIADLATAADGVLTCTSYNADHLRRIPGVDASRVHTIYHGTDPRRFAPGLLPRNDVPVLTSVARLVPKKGYDCLLEALALLSRSGVAFRYEVYGDGREGERLRAQAERLGLGAQVEFFGKVPSDVVVDALQRCDLFLCGSREAEDGDRDGIPNSLAEAMATALPVVATKVSGIPELVEDGVSGVLVPPNDPRAVFEAVARLLGDPGEGARLGQAARRRVVEVFDSRCRIEDCKRVLLQCTPSLAP